MLVYPMPNTLCLHCWLLQKLQLGRDFLQQIISFIINQ